MSAINILDSSIYNRIAAGEVVESPVSVVKELVENSIDSKCTSVRVTVKGGGTQEIVVADNGVGISEDDLERAFLPHATSKVRTIKDLEKIHTLGFRGEALASIAAVSEVTLTSRQEGCELGSYIKYSFGTLVDKGEVGASVGTTVSVKNLFAAIPARKKFLQTEQKEESKIISLVQSLILANPNIAIEYSSETKQFSSPGEGEDSAVYTVYGKEIYDNCVPIFLQEHGITVGGHIGLPSYTKHSKAFQNLIVNGRVVKNDDLAYTIYGVYSPYVMKRQYPVYAVRVDVPDDFIDVNVHPNKMQVKFANTALVKALLASAVKSAINKVLNVPKSFSGSLGFVSEYPKQAENLGAREQTAALNNSPKEEFSSLKSALNERLSATSVTYNEPLTLNNSSSFSELFTAKLNEITANKEQRQTKQQSFLSGPSVRYDGKIFNTYLVFDDGESAYFVDQHAAHEKLNYDKLIEQFEKNKMVLQDLLVPYEFTVSPKEADAFDENIELLKSCGFVVMKKSDYTYNLCTVPLVCSTVSVERFIPDMLNIIYNGAGNPQSFCEDLMQAACKSAVKGEDDIKVDDILYLIAEMTEKKVSLFCPHGRPIVVKIPKKEIEKWFKRIV